MITRTGHQGEAGKPGGKAPTRLSRRFVRYVIGFGVSVAIGLAPYLGALDVPLFVPVIRLFPETLKDAALPLSAALMGIVAVVVQWYGSEGLSRARMKRLFWRAMMATLVALAAVFVVHTLVVVSVPIEGGQESVTFLVGFSRPVREPCGAEVSDSECIRLLTFDQTRIEAFWGDRQMRLARLAALGSYLLFTGFFASLVGLLLVREEERHREKAAA